MRKEVKIVVLLIISLLIINIKVEAATGTGICYNKTVLDSSGYCKLDSPISISGKNFSYGPLNLTNGKSASLIGYHGVIEGKNQEMFCIDPNLPAPGSTPYPFARPFSMNSDYDRALAKVYLMFINDVAWEMNNSKVSFEAASINYEQIANVAMRALTVKYKYDYVGDAEIRENHFDKISAQFEGKKADDPKLVEGTQAYKLAQKYYCSAILSCKNCNSEGIPEAKTFCSKLPGASTAPLWEFKFNFNADPAAIETVGNNPDRFERIVPVKITGLDKMLVSYDSYKVTNPNFYITGIKCNNDKLKCELVDAGQLNKNLVDPSIGGEYTLKVRVSGNTADFKNEATAKILIDYKFYHILDVNNLAVLRYHLTAQAKQRMVALMPNREQKADASISIVTPSMCEAKTERGNTKFYYGGVEHQEVPYMQKGCCNVEPDQLKTKTGIDYFMENCATEDLVILDTKCDNDSNPDNMSESSVLQQSMDKVMKIVNMAEESYDKQSYTYNQLKEQLKRLDNNRDDIYMADVQGDNDYCKLYTSEKQLIAFPGTVEATSGRFFIFGDGEQPRVDGEIYANFHTDYARWKKDYLAAIEAEKVAYTNWESAKNFDDAIRVAGGNGRSRTCSYSCNCRTCNCGENGCSTCCDTCYANYTSYSGSATGTYYNADSSVQGKRSASWETYTRCSGSAKPNANVSYYKGLYDQAVAKRQKLETYKNKCQEKSDIASKWKYYLEPDLVFNYKQEYYDSINDKTVEATEQVEMKVSKKAETYWPMVSTDPIQLSGSRKGNVQNERYTILYGGGGTRKNETKNFDANKDYGIGYEQTLYYIPTVKYYSLLPNGKYATNITNYQSGSYIDVGYVFNVEITNYKNEYYTWFTIGNTGHLMQDPKITPKLTSNVQKSIDKKLEDINDPALKAIYNKEQMDQSMFNNICYYTDEEILYQRECPTCKDDNAFKPQYFYRTIATDNVFPNEGVKGRATGANWTNEKGKTAKANIEKLGLQTYAPENLEYSFILSPTDMQKTKELNRNSDYSDFNLKCNKYGKECESSFVEELAKKSKTDDLLYNTRNNGWKYFVNKGNSYQWMKGRIQNLLYNGYPDENEGFDNWP